MQQIANGDEGAFTELYHTYSHKMYEVALMYGNNDAERAQEWVQQIFVRVWDKREKLPEVQSMEDWLFILARNLIFENLKKEAWETGKIKEMRADHFAPVNDTDHPLLQKEYSVILQKAIDQLPPQQRKVYVLAKQEGLAHEDIAQQLSLSKLTIKTHVKLGSASVRKFVAKHLAPFFL
jgi:RNA polymerase sigma factor (sigma-70 family)